MKAEAISDDPAMHHSAKLFCHGKIQGEQVASTSQNSSLGNSAFLERRNYASTQSYIINDLKRQNKASLS